MSGELLDEAMKAQLAVEWERFRKAFSQAGEIGELNLEEWRIVAERDRKGLPPAVSFVAVQRLLPLEKSGLRGQAFRGGGETKDPTMRQAAQAPAPEVPIQDADHNGGYAAMADYAGGRVSLAQGLAAGCRLILHRPVTWWWWRRTARAPIEKSRQPLTMRSRGTRSSSRPGTIGRTSSSTARTGCG